MAALREDDAQVLAGHLFVPTERWGWQYVDPAPARGSPELRNEPRWVDPLPPDLRAVHARQERLKSKALGRGVIVGSLLLLGIVVNADSGGPLLIVIALLLGAIWSGPLLLAYRSAHSVRARYEEHVQGEWIRYNAAREHWAKQVQQWNAEERARRDVTNLWFPLELRSCPQRVDVFGGTPDGWAALLCTAGTTIMASGTPMLVIDFTEEDVTGPLCSVAKAKGFPASRQSVPENLEAARLLEGLDADAIAELIAESVDTMRRGGEDVELELLDVELIQAVVTRLDDEVTFRRIAAGLLALQQGYDPDQDKRLTAREFQRLTEVVDAVAATERTQNELQFLRGILDMLPTPVPGEEYSPPQEETTQDGMWLNSGVSVLRTEDDNRRRRDFVDRLMAQVLLQNVRRHRHRNVDCILVLAGADHLGAQTLELLARRCRQAGIRLMLMMEHLRGDLQNLLGGSDSATFIMRLGNAQEATAAAEHIGRGHQFLLTQLTRQSGRTDTTGTSHSTGLSTSDTTGGNESRGSSSRGWFDRPTVSGQYGTNWNITTGDSEQWSTNDSRAISTTDGKTVSRVYEFSVEPTTIQSLDVTSFLFVESADNQRRVVAGMCDPYLALMPRVAGTPFSGHPARSRSAQQAPQQVVLDKDEDSPGQPAFGGGEDDTVPNLFARWRAARAHQRPPRTP